MNKTNINSNEVEETKQERNSKIIAVGVIFFSIIMVRIALNNFLLFIIICIIETIIFSIANATVVYI